MSLSHHQHGHLHVSVSPRLDSPFLFPAFPHVPYLLPPVPEVRGKLAHSAEREYGLHRRVLPLHILLERDEILPAEIQQFHSILVHFLGHNQPGIRVFYLRLTVSEDLLLLSVQESPNLFMFRVLSLNFVN